MSVIHTARSESDANASTAGSVLGTPGYMAPEQARGELDRVDERADVFGLGAILCEVLTGEPAFVGRNGAETIRKAGRGEVAEAWARLECCGADPELIGLAKDCLAPEREDRPRRAGVIVERITAHLSGVQERLRAAEVARAEERRAPTRPRHGHGPSGSPGGWRWAWRRRAGLSGVRRRRVRLVAVPSGVAGPGHGPGD